MTIWKRAWLYIWKKKKRTILLLMILCFLSTLVLLCLTLGASAAREGKSIQKNLGSSFVLEADLNNQGYYEPRTGEGYTYLLYTGPKVTDEIIEDTLAMDGVSDYTADRGAELWVSLQLRPGAWAESITSKDITQDMIDIHKQIARIYYYETGALHPFFRNGAFEIVEGRNIQKGDSLKAVISEEVAKKNNLGLGDSFELRSFEVPEGVLTLTDWSVTVEIVGIYQVNFFQESTMYTDESELAENLMFMDLHPDRLVKRKSGYPEEPTEYTSVTFYVDSPEILDTVLKEMEEQIDLNGLLLERDDNDYIVEVKPYRQVSAFLTVFVILAVLLCGVLIYLICSLWIRERKRETGILLSLGFTRGRICLQFVLESLMTAAAAFLISCVLAGPAIRGAGAMAEELTAPGEGERAYSAEVVSYDLEIEKVAADRITLDTQMDGGTLLITAALICGISAGSAVAASAKNFRKNPKEMLEMI